MPTDYERLMAVVRGRRSTRRFRPDPVSAHQLEQVLEAARWAPSATNRQAFRFLVVRDPVLIQQMAEAVQHAIDAELLSLRKDMAGPAQAYAANFLQFRTAPLVIATTYRVSEPLPLSRHTALDAISSVAAAVTNMLLAAHAMGLGACWMTGPLIAEDALNELLEVPDGWDLAALVPLGVPDEQPIVPPRRTVSQLCQTRTAKARGEDG